MAGVSEEFLMQRADELACPPHGGAVVHVVDDDTSVRAALSRLFSSVSMRVRTYGSVSEFVDAEAWFDVGCIVLDVRLPGMSGLDFQQRLRELNVCLPVILMTGYGDIPMTVRAMKAGAIDFLTKPFREQEMLDAVTAAMEKDRARRASEEDAAAVRSRFEGLSPRERQVMMLVVAGKMNKQVAGDLGLSLVTVKVHRGRAMRKMRARTFAELVRMASLVKLGTSDGLGGGTLV
jgi:FixJ family two-component response regulator